MIGIGQSQSSRIEQCTEEMFWKVVRLAKVADICARIADAQEQVRRGEMSREDFATLKKQLKAKLPVITPHATFDGGLRRNNAAKPSGLAMLDIDNLPDPAGFYRRKLKGKMKRLGIMMVHVTPSGEGLRIVFVIPKGMTIEMAQKWLAGVIDTEYDEKTKDLARCSYLVPETYILYINKRIFGEIRGDDAAKVEDASCAQTETGEDAEGAPHGARGLKNPQLDAAGLQNPAELEPASENNIPAAIPQTGELEPASENNIPAAIPQTGEKFKGMEYAEIIAEWFSLMGGEPVEGERNDKLHRLAVNLRYITDDNEEKMLRIMPRYGLDEMEMRALIHSACISQRYSLPKKMSDAMRNVEERKRSSSGDSAADGGLAINGDSAQDGAPATSGASRSRGASSKNGGSSSSNNSGASSPRKSTAGGQTTDRVVLSDGTVLEKDAADSDENPPAPPEMPEKLPPLIELLLSRTPMIYRPAVAHAVFPSLATHLHQVKFEYIDGVEHEATLMCVLMAGTGAGKSCITKPIDRIMADIRQRDEVNLQREREWKDEMMTKGANKDRRKRPEGLVIQEIDPDMTNPAFVMRTAEAQGHFLYTNMNEIDQFDALKGSSRSNQQFQIMCLAFDPDNRYGQTRVGAQSVTEKVQVRFNWNASTTIDKGRNYFRRVVSDGPVSRINFCTIPEREIGAEMPVFGKYDEDFDCCLALYISRLNSATGLVECPEAYRLAQEMMLRNAELSAISQNRTYENLSFRANVIAWLKGCVLYVANGCKWDDSFDDFVRWSLDYDLWCKMRFFGDLIDKSAAGTELSHRGPANTIAMLPEVFTLSDVELVRSYLGVAVDRKSVVRMVSVWTNRGYVERTGSDTYRKTELGMRMKRNV